MNRNGWSALMYACYMGHDVTSQCLMRAGADLTMTSQQGSSPLILASMCGNDNIIKILLQPEVSVLYCSIEYSDPLLLDPVQEAHRSKLKKNNDCGLWVKTIFPCWF